MKKILLILLFPILTFAQNCQDASKNIIIGDSCTPLIAKHTENAKLSIWKGGIGVSWLTQALDLKKPDESIANVIINIGTNDGFSSRVNIEKLFRSLVRAYPCANFIAVQGSWGWGGNKRIKQSKIKAFYEIFRSHGAYIIDPPIGSVRNPHLDLKVYSLIGKEIDKKLKIKN
jgi:hypothetical protein